MIRRKFFSSPKLNERERMAFVLAAYNMGPERVQAMRAEAKRRGLNPNQWFFQFSLCQAQCVKQRTVCSPRGPLFHNITAQFDSSPSLFPTKYIMHKYRRVTYLYILAKFLQKIYRIYNKNMYAVTIIFIQAQQ